MHVRLTGLALVAVWSLGAPAAATADEAQIAEVRAVWSACEQVIARTPDGWIGWRRDFYNGYGDHFNFWDNRAGDAKTASVLRTTHFIDGVAVLTTTYCYRADESLAFVFTVMDSPNSIEGPQGNAPVSREGRVYFGQDGASALRVLGRIVDNRKGTHPLDSKEWQPMRGCSAFIHFRNLAEVEKAYLAELGDIEGQRPVFQPIEFDWCSKVTDL